MSPDVAGGPSPPFTEFVSRVVLERVVARDATWCLYDLSVPQGIHVALSLTPPTHEITGDLFRVEIHGAVHGTPAGPEGQNHGNALFRLMATFAAQYRVGPSESGAAWQQEYYALYARTSSFLHIWPYFREFCSSSTARMGLPPIFLDTWVITPPSA